MRYVLLYAAIPALLGSFFIMKSAQAGSALIRQQILIATIAAVICAIAIWRSRTQTTIKYSNWIIAATLIALAVPSVMYLNSSPHRWISLGGFRLYVAAVVLPAVIFILAKIIHAEALKRVWPLFACVAIVAALAVQPDASQATAFAVAISFALIGAKLHLRQKFFTVIAIVACVVYAWLQPDPLAPVPYVEGVFDVAQSLGVAATIAAVIAVALLPLMLAWHAYVARSWAALFVAIYYVAIDCFAYMQLTPMPLLGFGASPILGYFFVAFLVSQSTTVRQR